MVGFLEGSMIGGKGPFQPGAGQYRILPTFLRTAEDDFLASQNSGVVELYLSCLSICLYI